jgi:hypothetical protein
MPLAYGMRRADVMRALSDCRSQSGDAAREVEDLAWLGGGEATKKSSGAPPLSQVAGFGSIPTTSQ